MAVSVTLKTLASRPRLLAVGAALLLLVIFAAFYNRDPGPQANAGPPPLTVPEGEAGKAGEVAVTDEAMKLAEIEVATAELRPVQEKLTVTGEIETGGNQLAKITPRAPGKVVRILANVGEDVAQGQILALLESAELAAAQTAYRKAAAAVRVYENNLARQQELADLGEFGSEELESSRSQALQAEQALQASRRSLAQEESALIEAQSQLQALQGELSKAKAELDVKKSHLARAESLPEVVSLQQLERLRADAQQAQADLTTAQARVREGQAQVAAARQSLQVAKKEQPLAQKQLEVSQSALAREERVYSRGYSRSQELLQAESELEMARLELENAAENVRLLGGQPGGDSNIAITSPIPGRIQDAALTLGESVDVEHVSFTVINLSHIWARLAVPPKDLAKVKVGNPVEFLTDSNPEKPLLGRVVGVGAAADETTRTVPVRAEIETHDPSLRAGAFTKAVIITDVRHQRLTVPDGAIQDHTGRATLYVAKPERKGLFEVRHITLGERGKDWSEVTEGLEPGESLAAHGTFYLKSEAMKSALSDGCCSVGP
jgi:cobalt-zinc-cadmium efflux system membrane fusion protein